MGEQLHPTAGNRHLEGEALDPVVVFVLPSSTFALPFVLPRGVPRSSCCRPQPSRVSSTPILSRLMKERTFRLSPSCFRHSEHNQRHVPDEAVSVGQLCWFPALPHPLGRLLFSPPCFKALGIGCSAGASFSFASSVSLRRRPSRWTDPESASPSGRMSSRQLSLASRHSLELPDGGWWGCSVKPLVCLLSSGPQLLGSPGAF